MYLGVRPAGLRVREKQRRSKRKTVGRKMSVFKSESVLITVLCSLPMIGPVLSNLKREFNWPSNSLTAVI